MSRNHGPDGSPSLTPLDQRIDEPPATPSHPRTARAQAAARCAYVRPSGQRCGSPTMRDHQLCYYHQRYRTQPGFQHLPLLDDPISIQCALHEVMTGLFASRLTQRDAALLLYGLQIASANLRLIKRLPAKDLERNAPADDFASPPPFAGRFQPEPEDERLMHGFLANMAKYPINLLKDHFPVAARAFETAAAAPAAEPNETGQNAPAVASGRDAKP